MIAVFLCFQNSSCIKEFSFEGAPLDSIPTNDSIPQDSTNTAPTFPQCQLCDSSKQTTLGEWSFITEGVYLCGTFTNSGFIGGNAHNAFTFFGPSACSIDTGIVVSVYLPVALNEDKFNLTTNNTAFYYYDHNAPKDIFISLPAAKFSVTIQSFIYATGIVTGTFQGTVFTANGDSTHITDGKFVAGLY